MSELIRLILFATIFLIGDDKGPIDGAQSTRTNSLCGVILQAPFISLIVKKPTPYAISLVFRNRADYDDVLTLLEMTANETRFSRQDFRFLAMRTGLLISFEMGRACDYGCRE